MDRYEDSFTRKYTRKNYNGQKIIIPPQKIFRTKEKQLSKRLEAQKYYREATERFIVAYRSYEKTGVLLQRAKVMGDIAKIEGFSYLHMKNANYLAYTISIMDQAKRQLNRYIKDLL